MKPARDCGAGINTTTKPASIRCSDLHFVLASAKILSERALPAFCAMSEAPFHKVDCHKGRPQPWLIEQAKGDRVNPYLSRASAMRHGHIVALIKSTHRSKGAAEVRRTWGASVSELLKELRGRT